MVNLREKIEKIIEMNGTYTVSFSLPCLHGYGNFLSCRGNIVVRRDRYDNDVYKIEMFNTDQNGRYYSDHGDYCYIIRRDGSIKDFYEGWIERIQFYKDKEIFTGSLPTGWWFDTNDADTLEGYQHLISILKAFGAQCSYEPVY